MGDTKTVIYYKVRKKSDPTQFHKGGVYDIFNTKGKVWTSLGQLRSFITMNMNEYRSSDMSNWEVVEYEVSEKAVKDIHEMVSPEKLIKLLTK